jgi:enoyl-CoA hydratase/carnithine racemase
MAEQSVLYNKKDHIGWIILNRPQTGNRFDLVMAKELAEICVQINGDQDVYAVFLTGAGTAFCTGGDFSLPEVNVSRVSPSEAIAALNSPIIAVVNGDAIGLGLELALACDLRLAADTARLGLPEIIEGQIPMNGGTQRLSRIVGKGKALEMVLTGEIMDAQAAFEIGLVNKVVKTIDLNSEVEKLAANLAAKAPFALRYAKEAVNKGLDLTLEQGLRLEADLYFLMHTTADRTEGIRSFLQKRKPEFRGK